MNTPPLLLGAALLFWGWHVGSLLIAMGPALFFEGSRLIDRRLNIPIDGLYRVWDLCAVLLPAAGIYLYAVPNPSGVVLSMVQWSPLIFFPIMAAQAYGEKKTMELSVFFLTIRKRKNEKASPSQTSVNISYPYFILCIAAASASNLRTPWFFAGVCLLAGWALWFVRTHSFSFFTWIGLLPIVSILGYGGSIGLHRMQKALEEQFVNLYSEYLMGETDPFKTSTAIGEIGTLKLSGEIVLRVKSMEKASMLLPQTSYNIYRASSWYTAKAPLNPLTPGPTGKIWVLQEGKSGEKVISISAYLDGGIGVLPLPGGSFQLEQLLAGKVLMNRLGAIKVEQAPEFVVYHAGFDPASSLHSPPDEMDLRIPKKEDSVMTKIAEELNLPSKSPEEILRTVTLFFRKNFKYSLDLKSGAFQSSPLENFLLRTRTGHCEYFGTATVLLLRKAGIAARYVVGYQAHEYDGEKNRFLVRGRDAHAWTIAYIKGKWVDVDTTPIAWIQSDGRNASFLEPLSDLWSQWFYLYSSWRWSEEESGVKKFLWYLLIPLFLFLIRRITSGSKLVHEKIQKKKAAPEIPSPGLDSEFYEVEKRLKGFGLGKYAGETASIWLKRLEVAHIPHLSIDSLRPVLSLHYRHRFDPMGISIAEKQVLKAQVELWLRTHPEDKMPVS